MSRIAFSSTGSVYGEATVIPTPEDAPFPVQTSLYAASKLALKAYRSVLRGVRLPVVDLPFRLDSRGALYPWPRRRFLQAAPAAPGNCLRVLGNGKQRKSYLEVQDCVDAILLAVREATSRVNVFNLGVDGFCEVDDSIGWICGALGLDPELEYTGGERGWVG